MKKTILLLAGALFLFSLDAAAQKAWTLLVYINGDNDLWQSALEDLNEMEVVGSTDSVDVAVQIDLPIRSMGTPPFNDTRRYHVEHDPSGENETIVSTQVWPESGTRELDMGSPATLADFFAWGVAAYPADRYALVIWDHGDGWKASHGGERPSPLKMISSDQTSRSSISVAEGELDAAMESITSGLGRKLDLLGLDACLMGMWEVDAVLENHADHIVQSEETEGGDGYDYEALLRTLETDPATAPIDLCRSIVGGSIASVGATLSCIDTSLLPGVTTAVDELAGEVIAALPDMEDEIVSRTDPALRFGDGDYADLFVVADRLQASSVLPASLLEAAGRLKGAVSLAVVRYATGGYYGAARGISIYYPVAAAALPYDPLYATGSGAVWAGTRWDEMLCSFSEIICAPDAYEPDDIPEDAKEIGPADPDQRRSLFPLNDTDFAFSQVLEGLEYTFQTQGDLDTYMWLQIDGSTIARNDDISDTDKNSRIIWTAGADDIVHVKIQHYGTTVGWNPLTGFYRLVMTWEGCNPLEAPVCLDQGLCEGTHRFCDTGTSTWSCPYPEGYSEEDSSCDGVDGDCDGQADEDVVPYACGTGECRVLSRCEAGVESCTPPDPPFAEDVRCDGLDEDCDGQIDEDASCAACDPAERPECLSDGVCLGTEPACGPDGAWTCPYPPSFSPLDESCDGLDNDCDGRIDEAADCGEPVAEEVSVVVEGGGPGCSIAMVR